MKANINQKEGLMVMELTGERTIMRLELLFKQSRVSCEPLSETVMWDETLVYSVEPAPPSAPPKPCLWTGRVWRYRLKIPNV